jgi:cysteinyl-tRNA synthetase
MTDLIRRTLEYNGYDVFLVRNITDVGHLQNDDIESGEDKLEAEARKTGRSALEIAQYYTEQYMRDSEELNILPPHLSPKATDHIPEIQDLTQKLLQKGLAYISDGNVYYDVDKFPDYGKLSGNTVEQLRAGGHGRQQMEIAEDKQAPEDFALWKKGDESRQMNWPSPWGVGFPGWHIECSAMSMKYLGERFDIHTGALDLVFPHHEDEIAQSQGITGKPPVNYWMHGEFLIIGNRKMKAQGNDDDSIKMSRSKGNVLLIETLKAEGIDPLAFRYLLLTAHYRSKLNYTDESITAAQNALNHLREDLADLPVSEFSGQWSPAAQKMRDAFHTAINDDLDMPTALALTREVVRDQSIDPAERRHLLLDFDRVLGLRLNEVEPKKPREISDEARELVRQRDEARKAKNWALSDQLRAQLKEMGYEVRDTAQGTQLV